MNNILITSTAVACATASVYTARCYSQISTISPTHISSSDQVPPEFKNSKAAEITNPNKHIAINDSRRITIKLPGPLSDEEILARYVKGFFGGWWFGPERAALRKLGKVLVNFQRLTSTPISKAIWSIAELSGNHAPPLDAVVFGAFRVVDRQVVRSKDGGGSYIDFAFGSDNGGLAGVHRFSVSRDKGEGSEDVVTIEFAHTGCNPRENKPLSPALLQTLHSWYAMVLFSEGVAEVVRA